MCYILSCLADNTPDTRPSLSHKFPSVRYNHSDATPPPGQ